MVADWMLTSIPPCRNRWYRISASLHCIGEWNCTTQLKNMATIIGLTKADVDNKVLYIALSIVLTINDLCNLGKIFWVIWRKIALKLQPVTPVGYGGYGGCMVYISPRWSIYITHAPEHLAYIPRICLTGGGLAG